MSTHERRLKRLERQSVEQEIEFRVTMLESRDPLVILESFGRPRYQACWQAGRIRGGVAMPNVEARG